MVKRLTALVAESDKEAARFVHWGATSQDAMDTGLVLQLRACLGPPRDRSREPLGSARRPGRTAPPYRHGRSDLASAGPADHARAQGRGLARRHPAPSGPDGGAETTASRHPTWRCCRNAGLVGRPGDRGRRSDGLRARPRMPSFALARHARSRRRAGDLPGPAHRFAGQDGPRLVAPDADRDRRGIGAGRRGERRLLDHAAQAQPRGRGRGALGRHAGAGAGRHHAGRHGPGA